MQTQRHSQRQFRAMHRSEWPQRQRHAAAGKRVIHLVVRAGDDDLALVYLRPRLVRQTRALDEAQTIGKILAQSFNDLRPVLAVMTIKFRLDQREGSTHKMLGIAVVDILDNVGDEEMRKTGDEREAAQKHQIEAKKNPQQAVTLRITLPTAPFVASAKGKKQLVRLTKGGNGRLSANHAD